MNTIFTLGSEPDEHNSINLDDLYERKKQYDLNTLSIYNKLLNRIHNRIKTASRIKTNENLINQMKVLQLKLYLMIYILKSIHQKKHKKLKHY